MSEQHFKVDVLGGCSEQDYSDCIAELAKVTVPVDVLPFIEEEEEVIEHTHDAHGLIVSASPITRRASRCADVAGG